MAARKGLSKKTRFEVFKRDSFTCQYCGRMAPDVILEVDHINPVANSGDNNIMNLVTSCYDCNRGKGKRQLSENDEIKKQQEQLKELNLKREQLKMLVDWKKELSNFEDEQVDVISNLLKEATGFNLSDVGKSKFKKEIKRFGISEVIESTNLSISQYYDGTNESVKKVVDYIPRICTVREQTVSNPFYSKVKYIFAILKRRFYYFRYKKSDTNKLLLFMQNEAAFKVLKDLAGEVKHPNEFWDLLDEWIAEMGGGK